MKPDETGPAKRVTIYFEDGETFNGRALHKVLVELLMKRKVRGATIIRGIGGFGHDGILHSAKLLTLAESLPVKIEFVETAEKVDAIIPELKQVIKRGLVDVSDTVVVHAG
jgi:PII-like signaling protein